MRVRRAHPDDAEAIAEIHVRSWQAAYRGQIADEHLDALSPDERVPSIRAWLETAGWLVLEDDDRVIGFAQAGPSRDDDASPNLGEVTTIYLDPSRWRQGGGRVLLDAVIGDLRAAGFAEATLWVLDGNDRAKRFYEAVGWRPDGGRKPVTIGEQTLDEVRYRRAL